MDVVAFGEDEEGLDYYPYIERARNRDVGGAVED
jgi:hypothetical protein